MEPHTKIPSRGVARLRASASAFLPCGSTLVSAQVLKEAARAGSSERGSGVFVRMRMSAMPAAVARQGSHFLSSIISKNDDQALDFGAQQQLHGALQGLHAVGVMPAVHHAQRVLAHQLEAAGKARVVQAARHPAS